MGSKVKVKNISILSLFFCLGYISNIFVLNWGEIDIYKYISTLREESVISEIDENVVLEKEICEPEVVVEEEIDTCPILVDISGAVKSPGVYCFKKGSSVVDAVKKAKGFTLDAGFKYISMRINLATLMIDNSKIYIPFEVDYDCKLLTFNLPKDVIDITIPDIEQEDGDTETPSECISINTATQQELETLSRVGPSTAVKIVEGRPYTVLEDLLDVSGIGDATFNGFKDSICL